MNLKQLFLGIVIFLGVYIVPMFIASSLGIRGLGQLVVAYLAFVVQLFLTILFFWKRQPTIGIVGAFALAIGIMINLASRLFIR